jgi:1-phosphofructokinase family hexose kinase
MIITVTPNPAVDVTYTVPALHPGQVHRVTAVARRFGGKGLNVARVLHALGNQVIATGLAGGSAADRLAADLHTAGIGSCFIPALPDIRTTVTVHGDDGTTTSFWEPGFAPDEVAAAVDALTDRVSSLLVDATAVVVSGSLPPRVDRDLPARLVATASRAGVPAVVDVEGEPLIRAASAGRAVLMPNRDELLRLALGDAAPAGRSIHTVVSEPIVRVWLAATALCGRGAVAVVTTLGADGMLACTRDGAWLARPPMTVSGNATGAGDAAAAAVAAALAAGGPGPDDWPSILCDAVALSASAVTRPVAGEVDLHLYRSWRELVTVEALEGR